VQIPFPLPPGFVPPPFNFFDFMYLYFVFVELVLLALPRKWGKYVLEILFPILRRML
jgi:hypothetical protein